MNWSEYQTWLENNILEEVTISDKKKNILRDGVADKYSLGNLFSEEQALICALTDLGLSIESDSGHNLSQECYILPSLNFKSSNSAKSWSELFPSKENVFFGKKQENKTELDAQTWQILEQIFEDWCNEEKSFEQFREEMNENELVKEFMIKTTINFNYDLLKKGNYENRLINWLAKYDELTTEKQEMLKEKKEEAEKMLAYLREVFKFRNEQGGEQIPWMQIAKYGGGGLLIILVVAWLWSKVKE